MYCEKCRKELEEDAVFCPFCGAPISPVEPSSLTGEAPASPQTPPSRGRRFLLPLGLFVLLAGAGCFLTYSFSPSHLSELRPFAYVLLLIGLVLTAAGLLPRKK